MDGQMHTDRQTHTHTHTHKHTYKHTHILQGLQSQGSFLCHPNIEEIELIGGPGKSCYGEYVCPPCVFWRCSRHCYDPKWVSCLGSSSSSSSFSTPEILLLKYKITETIRPHTDNCREPGSLPTN